MKQKLMDFPKIKRIKYIKQGNYVKGKGLDNWAEALQIDNIDFDVDVKEAQPRSV